MRRRLLALNSSRRILIPQIRVVRRSVRIRDILQCGIPENHAFLSMRVSEKIKLA